MSVEELARELISIPSTLGKTAEIEEFVAEILRQSADPQFIGVPGKGRSVMARAINDDAPDAAPTILLNGHLDTVEACRGWTREPFEPSVEGDRLYGLGAADMKGGISIGLLIFHEMAGAGHNVIWTGSIDEEGDSAGAFALMNSGKLADADICLIQEPTHGKVMMGCLGRYVIDVNVGGKSAHGATPELGINAIVEASKLAAALDALPIRSHELLGAGSQCALEMHGGTTTLSVPESCQLIIDRHVVPGDTKESVVAEIKQLAESLNSPATFDIKLLESRPTPFLEPWVTEPEGLAGDFLRAAQTTGPPRNAGEPETGGGAPRKHDAAGGTGAQIDAAGNIAGAPENTVENDADGLILYGKSVGDYNAFAQHIPTVVYGPHGENWHMADEWVSVRSLESVMETYRRFFSKL